LRSLSECVRAGAKRELHVSWSRSIVSAPPWRHDRQLRPVADLHAATDDGRSRSSTDLAYIDCGGRRQGAPCHPGSLTGRPAVERQALSEQSKITGYGARAHPCSSVATLSDDHPDPVDLTVVLPFYNPGEQVLATVERTVQVLSRRNLTFEVLAVSDGSTDGSEGLLDGIHPQFVTVVVLPTRSGKGQAVREGLLRGRGRYLGFLDGDGDVPPDLLADFVDVVEAEHPDIVIGSKRHPRSQVVYPLARRLYSWGYQQLVRAIFRLDVHDTQAGIKLVRRDVLSRVLPVMVEQGYAFDLELLVVANLFGHRRVVEAPVRIGRRFSSTVSPSVVAQMLADTVAIWWRLHVRHAYGSARGGRRRGENARALHPADEE
jgi:glycosyltransferase involved in cell wall biosynthesis